MSTKNWKRIISMMLCIALLAGNLPAISAAETSGTCGNNLSWTLDSSGTLTITGTGDMYSYYGPYSSGAKAPWFDNKSQIKRVQIEAGVTSVGNNAFNQCTNLTQVSLPEGISVGEFAFYDTGLTTLVLPEQAIIAGRNAFGNNPLVSVTIPGSATIYDYSFQNCKQLTQLSLGEGMTTLVNGAFKGCSALQTVTIPSTVSLMETIAFDGCTQLQTVTFTGDMPTFESNVFRGATLTVYYPANNQTWDTKPTDHGGTVTWIATCGGDHDFAGGEVAYTWSADNSTCTAELTCGNAGCQVTQTQTVVSAYQVTEEPTCIADGTGTYTAAFAAPFTTQTKQVPITTPGDHNVVDGICTVCRQYGTCGDNLIWTYHDGTLTITGTGEMTGVPWSEHKENITQVVLSEGITTISGGAFSYSKISGIDLPQSLTKIGASAFFACYTMVGIDIPANVTSIGTNAFWGCRMSFVRFQGGAPEIGYEAFYRVTTKVFYPSTEASWNSSARGQYGGTLTWVAYGGSHTEHSFDSNNVCSCGAIGGKCGENAVWTFDAASGTIIISGTGAMTDYSTQRTPWTAYEKVVRNIIVEEGITTLSDCAFKYFDKLDNVSLPSTLETIGYEAFLYCPSLREIDIPSGVTTIRAYAFEQCHGLEKIVIPSGMTTISSGVFNQCTNLTEITIPLSISVINRSAFNGCAALTDVYYGGNAKTWSGIEMGSYNDPLSKATIHYTDLCADGHTWQAATCTAAKTCSVCDITEGDPLDHEFNQQKAEEQYLVSEATCTKKALYHFSCACGEEGTETFEHGEINAANHVFDANTHACDCGIYGGMLNGSCSWTLIDGTLTIDGQGAMGYMSAYNAPWYVCRDLITALRFTGSITTISDYAFQGCKKLSDIELPESITKIGANAFQNCAIAHIDIPSAVTSIGDNAFSGCAALTGIVLPENLTSIGAGAFRDCSKLQSINIPSGVKEIKANTFYQCYALRSIILPEGFTSIGASAFYKCSGLAYIYIPKTVTTIGEKAFQYSGLWHVLYAGSQSEWANVSIGGYNDRMTWDEVTWHTHADSDLIRPYDQDTCTTDTIFKCHYGGSCTDNIYSRSTGGSHSWQAATCTVPKTCSACGVTEGTPLGHVYDQQKAEPQYLVSEATCTEKAVYRFSCACGKEGTETFEYGNVKPHTYESKVTAPTCTEGGYTTHTCAACGDTYTDTETAALGHDWKGTGCTRCDESRENPFVDVPENSFFIGPVLWAVEKGITNGVDDTHFGPDANCMRAAVVTFLWRAAGEPEPTSANNPFTDVKESDYFYKAVLWAVEKGITNGMTATTFGPTAQCNRAQVVTFLWRAMGKPAANATEHPFTDVDEGQFYFEPMLWAVENGITNGLTATTFGPTAQCNRAQVVTFLYRAYNK